MKKTLIALAASSAMLAAGSAMAECPAYQAMAKADGYHNGFMQTRMITTSDSSYAQAGLIKVGGGYGYGAKKASKPDIVDTAVSAGSFNTLVQAVQAAGLVDVLKGDGPYTVFAPTDEAFAKLPEGTLEALLADKEKLAQVLKYHVVPGKLDASKVTAMSDLDTAAGAALPVDSIKIAQTDIMTSNGIIHVIDEVLIPQS